MLSKISHAPINLYFDVTPVGRVLNKFSNDLLVADTEMGWNVGFLMTISSVFLQTTLVSVVAVPWLALTLPIIFLASYLISIKNIPVFKEMNRVTNVTKSPMLSLIQETHTGSSTIRAFNR